MAIVVDVKYNIQEIVYLVTDREQLPRMVYSYVVYKNEVMYRLLTGTITSEHYEFELSSEKNILVDVN